MFIKRNFIFFNKLPSIKLNSVKHIKITTSPSIQILITLSNHQVVRVNKLTKGHIITFLHDLNHYVKNCDHIPQTHISDSLLNELLKNKQTNHSVGLIDYPGLNEFSFSDTDLQFTQWRTQKITENRYMVSNPRDKKNANIVSTNNGKYSCTCGHNNCIHIQEVKHNSEST
jgi:hypothetical protein